MLILFMGGGVVKTCLCSKIRKYTSIFNYVKRNAIYQLSNFAGFYKNFFLVSQTIQYNLNTMEKMELEDCILVDNGSQGSIEFKME